MATQRFKDAASSNNTAQPPQQDSSGIIDRSANFLSRIRDPSDSTTPFAGRLGGNLTFALDRSDPENASLLARVPDAAPNLSFRQSFDMRGFAEPILYKAGVIELFGNSCSLQHVFLHTL